MHINQLTFSKDTPACDRGKVCDDIWRRKETHPQKKLGGINFPDLVTQVCETIDSLGVCVSLAVARASAPPRRRRRRGAGS